MIFLDMDNGTSTIYPVSDSVHFFKLPGSMDRWRSDNNNKDEGISLTANDAKYFWNKVFYSKHMHVYPNHQRPNLKY